MNLVEEEEFTDEVQQTYMSISFRDIKDDLRLNNISSLKAITAFSNGSKIHRDLLNTVLRKVSGKSSLISEAEWKDLGFIDAEDIMKYFKEHNDEIMDHLNGRTITR